MPDHAENPNRPLAGGPIRAMVALGTGPEAIKLAPVVRAMTHLNAFEPIVVSTGRYPEMLDLLGIDVRVDLAATCERRGSSGLTGRLVGGLDRAIRTQRPDLVIVQGDTTTALCGALAASYEELPVAHVEAGVRTRKLGGPFPQEINRRLIGRIARWHFAPTPRAAGRLHAEGVPAGQVIVTGDTAVDNLLWVVERRTGVSAFRTGRRRLLVTPHRRESHGAGLARVIRRLADRGDNEILLPLHRSPAVREWLLPGIGDHPCVTVTEPLGYADFAASLAACDIVLTDSDGVEEAPALGKPVLVLRATTERPEAVDAGVAKLVGTDVEQAFVAASRLLDDPVEYERMAGAGNPFGDGQAARHILTELSRDRVRPKKPPAVMAGRASGPPALP